jgi:hypothetical protein
MSFEGVGNTAWANGEVRNLWGEEPKESKAFSFEIPEVCREFFPPVLCLTITGIALNVFKNNYLVPLFIGCAAFLITSVVRKVFSDYTFFMKCEEFAGAIANDYPYLNAVSAVVTVLFTKDIPLLCIPLAAGIGTLTALTFRIRWLDTITDSN